MTSHRFIVGDVFDVLRSLDSGSVDLVMTSPPFLALRSYLPADHVDKAKEIGSEATPADFIDTLLDVVEECRRVLAPHGSLVFELGDTYSGSGERVVPMNGGIGWPLDKSLTLIPTLFSASLAYGRNLLRPEHTIEPWRIRNVVAWCRPNPPVGALADKFRPATSYLTVATMARDRWFDMDAVRTPSRFQDRDYAYSDTAKQGPDRTDDGNPRNGIRRNTGSHPAGAPLLDYWEISTQPYKGSHYATFPEELPRRVILSMCPERVCVTCGEPSRRIVEAAYVDGDGEPAEPESYASGISSGKGAHSDKGPARLVAVSNTVGWTDCGHNAWRPGIVLDPFAGSGTTLRMALGNGRSSIGIDLDERNAELARERVGPMYLEVEYPQVPA
jgi:DNA modification methylase